MTIEPGNVVLLSGEETVPPNEALDNRVATERLFSVSTEEVLSIAPSAITGAQCLQRYETVFDISKVVQTEISDTAENGQKHGESELIELRPHLGRTAIRSAYKKTATRDRISSTILIGAQYLATFDEESHAIKAGRQILFQELDSLTGDMYNKRIVPAYHPLRHLKQAAQQVRNEVDAVMEGDDSEAISSRYTLLKAFGHEDVRSADVDATARTSADLSLQTTVAILYGMGQGNAPERLLRELNEGVYDRLIARDIVDAVDKKSDYQVHLEELRQLMNFTHSFIAIDKIMEPDALRNRMADMVDVWPRAQRRLLTEARHVLSDNMKNKQAIIAKSIRENKLVIENPEDAFVRSVGLLWEEILKNIPPSRIGRAAIAQYHASKRRRSPAARNKKRRAHEAAVLAETTNAEERIREPARIVVCNLNDSSIDETPDAMVGKFIKEISQGNGTLRADIEAMLSFMARRDLPSGYRRGIKTMQGIKVHFGTNEDPDKLWDLFEFKPTEAAGLSTRTSAAKTSRIYFIKLDDDRIGLVGIKARKEQESFVRSIRTKMKQRG